MHKLNVEVTKVFQNDYLFAKLLGQDLKQKCKWNSEYRERIVKKILYQCRKNTEEVRG